MAEEEKKAGEKKDKKEKKKVQLKDLAKKDTLSDDLTKEVKGGGSWKLSGGNNP
jgi:hypothetical protein